MSIFQHYLDTPRTVCIVYLLNELVGAHRKSSDWEEANK